MTSIRFGILIFVAYATIFAAGCRSASDYRASELPADLLAKDSPSSQNVDMSAIARQSINQDIIYPGDVLELTISTGLEEREPMRWNVRVTETGLAEVPLIGEVWLGGLGMTEAEQAIREASMEREIFNQPHVSVLMKQRKTLQVRVVGAVDTPGVYDLPAAGSDLLAALVAAGGLSEKAGTQIELRHPNVPADAASTTKPKGIALASFATTPDYPPRTTRVDLALADQTGQLDLRVEDGTVVMVKEREKSSVSVMGLVKKPDSYEIKHGEPLRVLDAIALAGGLTVSVADKVRVIRQVPGREQPVNISVSLRKAKTSNLDNLMLMSGDMVVVEETPTTVVVDTLRGFFRFGLTGAIPGL